MKLTFLGGAGEVGRLGMLIEQGQSKLVCDYGLAPTKPPKLPVMPPKVDHVLLTHAHVDHSGMVPMLTGTYNSKVICTPPTADVALMLMADSLKVMGYQGFPEPYNKGDIRTTDGNFDVGGYDTYWDVGPWEVEMHSAGHIPGSAMFKLIDDDKSLMFTGDINTVDTNLVAGNRPVKCDTLVVEGTYAGREHPAERARIEFDLLNKIEEVVSRGGKVILPAFAVGRTQELMLMLRNKGYEVRVDGMGRSVNKMYLEHSNYVKDAKKLRQASREVQFIKGRDQRRNALKAEVIITTSGMLDGGPVLDYLGRIKRDENSAVLMTGYQVEGTNGRMLRDTGTIDIDGTIEKIHCELGFYDLSAHAGHSQLVEFIKGCKPEKVVLMHSDNRQAIVDELGDQFEFMMPDTGNSIDV